MNARIIRDAQRWRYLEGIVRSLGGDATGAAGWYVPLSALPPAPSFGEAVDMARGGTIQEFDGVRLASRLRLVLSTVEGAADTCRDYGVEFSADRLDKASETLSAVLDEITNPAL